MLNATRSVLVTIAALVLAACGGGSAPQEQKPAAPPAPASATSPAASSSPTTGQITARSLLEKAQAAAVTWQADAELVGVTTSLADGPAADFWFYDFQSPSKGACTRIRALADGRVVNTSAGSECVLMKPVSATFVDSPIAYEAATTAGFKKGESVQFGLRFQGDRNLAAPRECWVVWSDADGDEAKGIIRGWCIDAVTGRFVTRLSGYGRTEPRR